MLVPKIIYEDNDILVIDKPIGLVVNRAETVKKLTLQDWIEKKYQIKNKNLKIDDCQDFHNRSGLVHRLDKDTSGLMVIAKNPNSYDYLIDQFKLRQVNKKYIALVHGKVEPKIGDVKMPLARDPKNRQKFAVRLGGRSAVTEYKRIAVYKLPFKEYLSLLEIKPKTGRTHQIRVHLSHLGYPIVGDVIYLNHKRLKKDRQWSSRLFLHAFYLSFIHPGSRKKIEFKISLPKSFLKPPFF